MFLDRSVPFYSNTPDDTHCLQASLKMVLKYFQPEEDFSWEDLDRMSAKRKGLWTWQYAACLWLVDHGYDVVDMETFDNAAFVSEGGEYLKREYSPEIAATQIAHSDIEQERKLAVEFIQKIKVKQQIPAPSDIVRLLEAGYLVLCNVNAAVLLKQAGYIGHSVLIKGITDTGFIMHDPGLPSQQNTTIAFELFEQAWAYPTIQVRNILAIKK